MTCARKSRTRVAVGARGYETGMTLARKLTRPAPRATPGIGDERSR